MLNGTASHVHLAGWVVVGRGGEVNAIFGFLMLQRTHASSLLKLEFVLLYTVLFFFFTLYYVRSLRYPQIGFKLYCKCACFITARVSAGVRLASVWMYNEPKEGSYSECDVWFNTVAVFSTDGKLQRFWSWAGLLAGKLRALARYISG